MEITKRIKLAAILSITLSLLHWLCVNHLSLESPSSLPALSHSPSSEEDVQSSSSRRGTLSKECFRYHNVTVENVCCPMLHYGNSSDILRCVSNALSAGRSLQGKPKFEGRVSWLFLGDSHTRYIFCALFSKLSGREFEYRLKEFKGKWRRLSLLQKDLPSCGYKGGNIEIRHTTLPFDITFHRDVFLTELQELKRAWEAKERPWPTLIVINNGMHWMRELNPVYLESGLDAAGRKYEEHLRTVAPVLHSIAHATTVVFKMQDDLQTVHNATSKVAAFSAANLAFYNAVFRRVLGDTDVLLWDSTLPLSLEYNLECIRNPRTTKKDLWWMCEDRTHVGYVLIHQYADMLLNFACNKYMGRRDVCYGDHKW